MAAEAASGEIRIFSPDEIESIEVQAYGIHRAL